MLIKKKITSNLDDPKVYFYLSFLSDRFESLNERWATLLEKRFGKEFEPIYILSNEHRGKFKEKNYIVINEILPPLRKQFPDKNVVDIIYLEDLNAQACKDIFIKGLVEKLVKKQGEVFVLSFTNARLEFSNPKVRLLGPKSVITQKYDNKVEQIKIFERLGILRHNAQIFTNFDDLLVNNKLFPCYVTASYSSGGIEAIIAQSRSDLIVFGEGLRPLNKSERFVVSEIIEFVEAPNVSALVCGEDDTRIVCITDQILRGHRYMGNIYPSSVNSRNQDEIRMLTKTVGNALAKEGFRGLFGMDFLINKYNKIHPIDLNPRRQGGYLCNVLMSKKINLIEQEFKLALGEPVDAFSEKDLSGSFGWAHSKLSPKTRGVILAEEYSKSSAKKVFEEFGDFYETYYPGKSLFIEGNPGVYITTRKTAQEALTALENNIGKLIDELYDAI